MELTNKDIELVIDTTEYDLVRYNKKDDREMYINLLDLHMGKVKYFIYEERFKTQKELTEFLYGYRDTFKRMSYPDNLLY